MYLVFSFGLSSSIGFFVVLWIDGLGKPIPSLLKMTMLRKGWGGLFLCEIGFWLDGGGQRSDCVFHGRDGHTLVNED